ncbi:Thimet oligopeptidase [Nymphon striatum]|nr:Thimet oligopeptidase [Nymphon striatum]
MNIIKSSMLPARNLCRLGKSWYFYRLLSAGASNNHLPKSVLSDTSRQADKHYQRHSYRVCPAVSLLSSQRRSFFTMSAKENEVHGVKQDWDYKITPEEMLSRTDELIKESRAAYNKVAAVKSEDVDFNTVVKAIADIHVKHRTTACLLDAANNISPDKALRDASTEAEQRLSKFDVEIRLCILKRITTEQLSPESKRFIERLIKLGKRNGLHLSQDIQDQLKTIKNRMNEIGIVFGKNLNEVTTFVEFDEESLVGLPEDFIKSLEKTESGKRKVTLKYPHYFPVARKAQNPKTRQIMEKEFNSQCIVENIKILEELVELRQKQADLLSYPTHAAFITEMRLAKTPENVAEFLTDLAEKLKTLWAEEKGTILNFKKEECEKYGYDYDGKINTWDTQYYLNMVEEKKYAVDQEKLREYFPLPVVTKGLLEIYQELLNLKFAEVTNPKVWHPDVQMPGSLDENGSRQISIATMLANFTKPTEDKPSLLDHHEVVTYFHEFGHVMHQLCSRADYCLFTGTCVERDFVEAPSQMLENWCWEKEPLRRMSGHYKNGSALPDEIADKLIASKNAFAVYKETSKKYLDIIPQEGTNFAAHFGHLAGGYDAQYYGYMWSEVFCMDMFASRFQKEGIMNKNVGKDYRRCILQPGGSKDGTDMLIDFLGREPNVDAFLKSKGLTA